MKYKVSSLVLGTVVMTLTCGEGRAAYVPFNNPPVFELDVAKPDIVSETRLYCLALAVYFEGGSTVESEEGQRHIARVVVERAKANRRKWGGADICDVVFYKRRGVCQFSFACLPKARRTAKGGAAWRYSFAIAQDELEGRSAVQEHTIRYYMNPALTPDRNVCRFKKEFVPVVAAGRHQFFREPTAAEAAKIARSEPAECRRHAEAVKAQKRAAAERLAKRKRLALAAQKKKAKKIKYARR